MKQRNPEATCATCPYWYDSDTGLPGIHEGACRREHPRIPDTDNPEFSDAWCGNHPEFFLPAKKEEMRFGHRSECPRCDQPPRIIGSDSRDVMFYFEGELLCEVCWNKLKEAPNADPKCARCCKPLPDPMDWYTTGARKKIYCHACLDHVLREGKIHADPKSD